MTPIKHRLKHCANFRAAPGGAHPAGSNDLKVGGRYLARMEAKDGSFGFDFDAQYTAIQSGENFTYDFGGRQATVEFKEQNGHTKVTVTFDPETENSMELQKNGWQAILNNFRQYVEAN